MSRHEIAGPPDRAVAVGNEIRVPLSMRNFRLYRDSQAVTATLGLVMTLGCGVGFTGVALYNAVIDAAHREGWIYATGGAALLPLMIGLATWPAMQTAKTLTRTLKEQLPALVINPEGIWDYSSNYVFGFISWSEIESVIATSRHSPNLNKDFPGIAFVVKNKNVLLRRKPSLTGAWLASDPEISKRRQIFIPQGRIDAPVEDVVSQINAFRARVTQ